MKNVLTLLALALVLVCATALEAQGRSPYRRNQNEYKRANDKAADNLQKHAKNAAKKNEQDQREADREAAKEERDAKRDERGNNNAGDAAEPEYVPQPGEVVEKALKEEIIDEWMDELALADKGQRDKFKRNVRAAWEDNEKEDKRYAAAYKKADTIEKMEAEKKTHQEKLKKTWDDSDAKLLKEKAVNDDQLAKWKQISTELRTKTATDLYYEDLNKQNEAKTKKEAPAPEAPAPEKQEKKEKKEKND